MLAAFANTFKVPELRKRIFFTFGLIFICRLVSMVPTPGVNWRALEAALASIKASGEVGGGLMGRSTRERAARTGALSTWRAEASAPTAASASVSPMRSAWA